MSLSNLFVKLGFDVDDRGAKKAERSIAQITDSVKTLSRQATMAAGAVAGVVTAFSVQGNNLAKDIKTTGIKELDSFRKDAQALSGELDGFFTRMRENISGQNVGLASEQFYTYFFGVKDPVEALKKVFSDIQGMTQQQAREALTLRGMSLEEQNVFFDDNGNILTYDQFRNASKSKSKSASDAKTLKDIYQELDALKTTIEIKLVESINANRDGIMSGLDAITKALDNLNTKSFWADAQAFFKGFSDFFKGLGATSLLNTVANFAGDHLSAVGEGGENPAETLGKGLGYLLTSYLAIKAGKGIAGMMDESGEAKEASNSKFQSAVLQRLNTIISLLKSGGNGDRQAGGRRKPKTPSRIPSGVGAAGGAAATGAGSLLKSMSPKHPIVAAIAAYIGAMAKMIHETPPEIMKDFLKYSNTNISDSPHSAPARKAMSPNSRDFWGNMQSNVTINIDAKGANPSEVEKATRNALDSWMSTQKNAYSINRHHHVATQQ